MCGNSGNVCLRNYSIFCSGDLARAYCSHPVYWPWQLISFLNPSSFAVRYSISILCSCLFVCLFVSLFSSNVPVYLRFTLIGLTLWKCLSPVFNTSIHMAVRYWKARHKFHFPASWSIYWPKHFFGTLVTDNSSTIKITDRITHTHTHARTRTHTLTQAHPYPIMLLSFCPYIINSK